MSGGMGGAGIPSALDYLAHLQGTLDRAPSRYLAQLQGTLVRAPSRYGSGLENACAPKPPTPEELEARRLAELQAAAERAERRNHRLLAAAIGSLFAVLSLFWWRMFIRAGLLDFLLL